MPETWGEIGNFQSWILCHQTGGQLFDLWAPVSSSVPGAATFPSPGPLSSPLCSTLAVPADCSLQNHAHFCSIHLVTHLLILYSFNVYWAPIGTIWKSCLHLLPERVCICINVSVQLVSFLKHGFGLESRCYSEPFLKAVSTVLRVGPTSPK